MVVLRSTKTSGKTRRLWPLLGAAAAGGALGLLTLRRHGPLARRLRRARRRDRKLLDLVLTSAPVGIALLDHKLRFLKVNDTLASLHGRKVGWFLGRDVRSALPELAGRLEPVLLRVLQSGQPELGREFEAPPDADGATRHWMAHYYPFRTNGHRGVACILVDIGARKRIEHSLAESRKQLVEVLESISDGFMAVDPTWRITMVNTNHERVTRVPREEVLGRNFWEVFPSAAEPSSQFWQQYQRCMKERVPVEFEEFLEPLDLWTEVRAYPNPKGGISVFFRDITARKRAQEALRLAEEHLRLVMESAQLGTFDLNIQDNRIHWSTTLTHILGVAPDVTPGPGDLLRFIHPLDRARLMSMAQPLEAIPEHQRHEARIIRSDGAVRWVSLTGRLLRDHAGRPVRLLGAVEDITERKRMEEELRRGAQANQILSEASAILASSLDYEETLSRVADLAVRSLAQLCIVDLLDEQGRVRRLRVVHADPKRAQLANALFGLEDGAPDPSEGLLQAAHIRGPFAVPAEVLAPPQPNGHQRQLLEELRCRSLIAAPLLGRQTRLGTLMLLSSPERSTYSLEDVELAGELARRAAMAIENARLYRAAQQAMHARERMMGVVAHDLRSPLTNIKTAAGLLQRQFAGRPDVGEVGLPIQGILEATGRMHRLILDLLDVASIEAGHLAVERAPMPLGEVLDELRRSMATLAQEAGLQLEVVGDGALPVVHADRHRVLQVLTNLVDNALKFSPRGGTIRVLAERRANEVRCMVQDNGPGIPPESLPHLFESFWQAVQDRRGAGLGLAISRGIVEAHHGRIWAESKLGEGTRVFFTLPLDPSAN